MPSNDDKAPAELPWFRRFLPDGKIEPHVAIGDNGEMMIIDGDGWAASFKDGKWNDGILFSHEKIAEFSPVQSSDEIYRLYEQARSALGTAERSRD